MILQNIRYIVTQNPGREILENVDLRIEDGEIDEIGEGLDNSGHEVIDCSKRLVMPGLINCHTHVSMAFLRGISDDKKLEQWLHEDIFPAEHEMTDEDVYLGAKLGIAEMLETGTTCFNDMYVPEKKVAEAVEELGIRAVMGYGFVDVTGDLDTKLEESREFIEKYRDHEMITPAVNPHAVYTCSEEALRRAKKQAEKYDVPLHIHLSETEKENVECRDKNGESPTEYLDSLGLLSDRTIAAHCVHLSDRDKKLLAEKNVKVAHNPAANLKLGSGVAEVPELISQGVKVGLGTDGPASNNNLNMFEEMKLASLIQKNEDPENMTGQEVLDMATCDAAEVLGLADSIGSIEEGKKADLITVDLEQPSMTPRYGREGLISNLVFSFEGGVEDVLVEGEVLVRNGELAEDMSDAYKRVQSCSESL